MPTQIPLIAQPYITPLVAHRPLEPYIASSLAPLFIPVLTTLKHTQRHIDIIVIRLYSPMLPPIPKLEDHSISYYNGFLPDNLPLRRLPDRYYEPWEDLVDNLQALILTKRIRAAVNLLPLLSASRLRTEAELQRAYSILGFICHSYIWGGDRPAQVSHWPGSICQCQY